MQREKEGDSVKIDLVIGDESDPSGEDLEESTATEVICLRILSNKTKFKFNGMEITVKSPAFEVGKTFAVNLDQNNRLAGIETFQESYSHPLQNNRHRQESDEGHSNSSSRSVSPCRSPSRCTPRRVSLVNSLGLKPARIIVNSSDETEANEGLPLLSARLALEEHFPRPSSTSGGDASSPSYSPTTSSPSSSFFRSKSKKNKSHSRDNPSLTFCPQHHPHHHHCTCSRNGSPIHRVVGKTCSLSSPPASLSPSPSPFRRTPSPSKISKLIGVDYEPLPGEPGYSQATSLKPKSFVSVGVGTTSNPKESLYFDLEGTFRRSRSWKK